MYYTTWETAVTTEAGENEMKTHLGSQTDDLPPSLHPQVCTDDPTDTRAQHLALVVEEHSGIVVKPDEAAVWPADGLASADDDSATDVALADLGRRGRGLDRDGASAFDDTDDLVADAAPAVVDFLFEDVDALDQQCARVVYDLLRVQFMFELYEQSHVH